MRKTICRKCEKMDISSLSSRYKVRDLLPSDTAQIYQMLKQHTIFYQYHPPMVTPKDIQNDMEALPPNKGREDKHYIGFFQNDTLIALMDLIEHYPSPGTAFIGFFATNCAWQGKGIGSDIISECSGYLKKTGFCKIRLGIDRGNPQSRAFWTKNHFILTGEEIPNRFSSYLIMERLL